MLVQLPYRLFTDRRFGKTDFKVYAYFYTIQSQPIPAIKDISKVISSNPDAISDAISRLQEFGFIKKQVMTINDKKVVQVKLLDINA